MFVYARASRVEWHSIFLFYICMYFRHSCKKVSYNRIFFRTIPLLFPFFTFSLTSRLSCTVQCARASRRLIFYRALNRGERERDGCGVVYANFTFPSRSCTTPVILSQSCYYVKNTCCTFFLFSQGKKHAWEACSCSIGRVLNFKAYPRHVVARTLLLMQLARLRKRLRRRKKCFFHLLKRNGRRFYDN